MFVETFCIWCYVKYIALCVVYTVDGKLGLLKYQKKMAERRSHFEPQKMESQR